jgi:tRNA(His) 5'-end guanylyltransferase
VEKLVSISAGLASAAFSLKSGHLAHFDSRLWVGNTEADVLDYFSWRQADASRCALNGWCYWVQRQAGLSAGKATARMRGLGFSAKNEILYEYGVNFNELPLWQRRGVGLWWETYEKTGHDPVKGIDVVATRRRVRIDRELPMKDEYRELVGSVSSAEPAR